MLTLQTAMLCVMCQSCVMCTVYCGLKKMLLGAYRLVSGCCLPSCMLVCLNMTKAQGAPCCMMLPCCCLDVAMLLPHGATQLSLSQPEITQPLSTVYRPRHKTRKQSSMLKPEMPCSNLPYHESCNDTARRHAPC